MVPTLHICVHYLLLSIGMENTAKDLDSSIKGNTVNNQETLELQVRSSNNSHTISDSTVNSRMSDQRTTSLVSSLLSGSCIDKISTAFKLSCLILLVVAVNQASIILYFTDQSDSQVISIGNIVDLESCSVSCYCCNLNSKPFVRTKFAYMSKSQAVVE